MKQIKECTLHRKIDRTMYEVNVRQSADAKESAEDILIRLIATDSIRIKENDNG